MKLLVFAFVVLACVTVEAKKGLKKRPTVPTPATTTENVDVIVLPYEEDTLAQSTVQHRRSTPRPTNSTKKPSKPSQTTSLVDPTSLILIPSACTNLFGVDICLCIDSNNPRFTEEEVNSAFALYDTAEVTYACLDADIVKVCACSPASR